MGIYIGYQAIPFDTFRALQDLPQELVNVLYECITQGQGILVSDTLDARPSPISGKSWMR